MKKLFTVVAMSCVCGLMNADIRVISDTRLGEGFFPRFVDAETVVYLTHGNADYRDLNEEEQALRVDNENLDLNLYHNGEHIVLKPHGDVNYIWSSLSPNKKYILFNTLYGTAICDLSGKELVNLGNINAPVWYGNDYVVGMNDQHDGYFITSSEIMMASVDGVERVALTKAEDMGDFYRVPADLRDLNYSLYADKFGHRFDIPDYNSDNARMLNVEEMKELLLSLDYVRERLAEFGINYD